MWLQMAVFHSFMWLSRVPLYTYTTAALFSTCWWTFELLPCFGCSVFSHVLTYMTRVYSEASFRLVLSPPEPVAQGLHRQHLGPDPSLRPTASGLSSLTSSWLLWVPLAHFSVTLLDQKLTGSCDHGFFYLQNFSCCKFRTTGNLKELHGKHSHIPHSISFITYS